MPRVRQGASGFRESTYTVDEDVEFINAGLGAQEALALSVGAENEDFTFTEALESETDLGVMDLEDGLTANWSSEVTKRVRVLATVAVFDVALGGVVEGDTLDVQVWVNEAVAALSDEGQTDVVEATGTFNIDKVINITGGDIIRLVGEAGALSEAGQYDVAAAGEFDLVPVD